MRRRNQLQVNTFPFLAVLLCAMGALILVLLVMDRKAKLAAQAKAQEKVRQQQHEYAGRTAARKREAEAKRKSALAAWEKRRDELRGRVSAEKRQLDDEMKRVEARLAEAAARLRREEDVVQKLRAQVDVEKTRLVQQEKAVAAAKQEAEGLTGKAAEANAARERLTAELDQLEKTLAQLREARQRDATTYSVVPYRGKRGDSRRPLYVECAAGGLIFHPDRLQVDTEVPAAIRQEVERRVTAQKEELARQGVSQARPYLMLLVRPDGILRRYQIEAAIRDLGVDFGYELVDAAWKLHFPTPDETRTAATPSPSPEPPPTPAKQTVSSGPVRLLPPASGPLAGISTSGKPVEGPPGNGSSIPGGSPADLPSLAGSTGPELGSPGNAPAAGGTTADGSRIGLPLPAPGAGIGLPVAQPSPEPPANGGSSNRPLAGIGLSRPRPYGSPEGETPASIGAGQSNSAPPHPDAPLPTPAVTAPARQEQTAAADGGIVLPPIVPGGGAAGARTPTPGGVASAATPGAAGEPVANGGSGGRPGFQGPTPAPGDNDRRELPLRPARVTNPGDLTIFVECRADCVVVYPTRKVYALSVLSQTPLYNPLYFTVRELMRRHLATPRPDGSTPRVQVRFLVHADAERSYHLAYPSLETVSVPKSRTSLLPDDDVGRIVTGY